LGDLFGLENKFQDKFSKKPVPPPPANTPTLKVLHLTDIHFDDLYREGD